MFKKLINNGVLQEQTFGVQNKIRIFNVAVLSVGLICLTYLTVGLFSHQHLFLTLTFIGYLAVLVLIFLLIRIDKSVAALHLMMICGLIFTFLLCIFFGEKAECHVIFLFVLIGGVVFGSKKYTFYYFLGSMACMIGAKIMYAYFPPLSTNDSFSNAGVFNLASTGILLYLSMVRFKAELSKNHKKLSEKNKIIESQQENIIDSINYAKHIQQSILAGETELQKIFPDSFIYFLPKDIVSGDFFWLAEIKKDSGNLFVLAVADCTGHGVPGAFLSMIGNMLLNKIVNEKNIIQPALILNELHKDVLASLHHGNNTEASEDGMDIAVCTIDPAKKTIEYAGAMNPIYIMHESGDKHAEIIQADSQSIGGSIGKNLLPSDFSFTNHKISFEKGSIVYLFSDGYLDQFSSVHKRRIGSERFKTILSEAAHLSMPEQKEYLIRTFNDWKGNNMQFDDVLVMGIKL